MFADPIVQILAVYFLLEESIIFLAGGRTILWSWLPPGKRRLATEAAAPPRPSGAE